MSCKLRGRAAAHREVEARPGCQEKEIAGFVSCKLCSRAAARREVGGRAGVLGKAAVARA